MIFYGYCNFQENLGGVAIDDIALFHEASTTINPHNSTPPTSTTNTDAFDHFSTENAVSIVDSTLTSVTKEFPTISIMIDTSKMCYEGIRKHRTTA